MALQLPPYFEGPSDPARLRNYLNDIIRYLNELANNSAVGPYLTIVANLGDLGDVTIARVNLGLGSAAVEDVSAFDPAGAAAAAQAASDPAGSAAAAQAASLQKVANLSDVADADTSRSNIGAAASGINSDIVSLNGLNIRAISSNASIATDDDLIEVDATGAAVTVTFDPVTYANKRVRIIKVDASSHQVSISDGSTVKGVIIGQFQMLQPYSNGTDLRVPLTLA